MKDDKKGLPFPQKKVENLDPRLMIIFGKSKVGKSSIVSKLENSLLVELEPGGAAFVKGSVIQVNNLKELSEIGVKIKEFGKPYKYIVIDTVTKLEEYVLSLAAKLYQATPMGKNWTGKDVKMLANGGGYLFLRKAFFQVIDEIQTWAEHIILVGHLKDTLINKDGEEFSSKELDLTGKIKSLVSAKADAVGYFFRKENEGFINFEPSEDLSAGCRSPHLEGRIIKISEKTENGEIKTNWKEIFKFN